MNSNPQDEHGLETLAGRGPRLTSLALPRRTVLRGAGLVMALPWLEAMSQASPGASEPPLRRLLYVYVPNGVKLDEWREDLPQEGEGRKRAPVAGEYALKRLRPTLKPLEPFKRHLTVLRGLAHDKARANGDGPGDHARAAATFLTGVQPLKTEGRVRLGISADQIAARSIGGATRIRSMALGTERGRSSGQCDSGYACAYSGNISWESAETPAAKEVNPRRAFDRLFRGADVGMSLELRERRIKSRRSLLDYVRKESKALGKRLGAADRARIDEYETGLRELERQLNFEGAAHVDAVPDAARPEGVPESFREHARLLSEVTALAFQTDVTRIATIMFGNEGSGRRYTEVGVTGAHHSISHHGGDEAKLSDIGKINRLHMESFAHLLDRLHALEGPGGGALIDHSMVVYGSGIAEGNRHDHHDLPMVLLAGEKTGIKGRRTVAFQRGTPANDLHLGLLANMGVADAKFGDGRGPLEL